MDFGDKIFSPQVTVSNNDEFRRIWPFDLLNGQNWTKNEQNWTKNGQILTKHAPKSNIFGHCALSADKIAQFRAL